mgnify:CR=1 FL=1
MSAVAETLDIPAPLVFTDSAANKVAELVAEEGNPELKLPKFCTAETPFVQILDPATGTGTFIVEVITQVHAHMLEKWAKLGKTTRAQWQPLWIEYVKAHLLPRLYAFELMMAPYIVTHLRLGLALEQGLAELLLDLAVRVELGGSAALGCVGAVKLARAMGPGKVIVTMLCDGGGRYQSRLFNPTWLTEKGFSVNHQDLSFVS